MKPNWYNIISECLETGITFGYNGAHKHTDTPTQQQVEESMHREIMNALHDKIIFNGIDEDTPELKTWYEKALKRIFNRG